jgi:hypothetical protein
MADSTRPTQIPLKFRQKPNGVALYADGEYKAPAGVLATFPRVIQITVLGDAAARYARVIDVERGDARPADVPGFLDARKELGREGWVYCDRSTVLSVQEALEGRPEPLWWIATLDGVYWTPEAVAADIAHHYGAHITPARIRAIQIADRDSYDLSLIYGEINWYNPQH